MDFQDVTFLVFVEALKDNATLCAGVHFINFVSEVPKASDGAVFNYLSVPAHSYVGISDHAAFRNTATCDMRATPAFKYFTNLCTTHDNLSINRIEHTMKGFLDVINQLVDNVVMANLYAHAVSKALGARLCSGGEAYDNRFGCAGQ